MIPTAADTGATVDIAGGPWSVTIFGLLPLPNEIYAMPLRHRMRAKRLWRQWTAQSIQSARVPYLGAATITFVRYSAGRPDDDAIPAAFKAVRDACIGLVIEDDDADRLVARYRAERCPQGLAHIELRIERGMAG
jgi:hypothetical protein